MSQMSRLAAGFTSRVNLAADLLLVAGGGMGGRRWAGGVARGELGPLLWVAAAAACAWVVAAAALRHYASFAYDRAVSDDLAMITTQMFAAITLLAGLHLVAPAGTPLPPIARVMPLLWLPAVMMRLLVFRLIAGRESPVEDVLIVGVGPIGRLTAQDMRKRGRQRVAGRLLLAY